MKKIFAVMALVPALIFNAGCTEEEVTAGAVGVAIGVGLGASIDRGDRWDNNDRWDNDRWDNGWDNDRWDDHDRWDRDRHRGGKHGKGRHRGGRGNNRDRHHHEFFAANFAAADDQIALAQDGLVAKFAQRHNISLKAASKIKQSFNGVAKQGFKSFQSIGLAQKDLTRIMNNKMVEPQTLTRIAGQLDLSDAQARDLIQYMTLDFNAQASDVKSDYWKACTSRGKWRTNQNASCSKVNTNGCSPLTGARLCI